ncbi:MAG: hypothetical protein ACI8RD_000362 [Bacillariaceae sp.]|jgi:hypothetical protein
MDGHLTGTDFLTGPGAVLLLFSSSEEEEENQKKIIITRTIGLLFIISLITRQH